MKPINTLVLVALIVGCDSGAPAGPTTPPPVAHLISVDTLRPGEIARVRGTGLTGLKSLALDGVQATELVASSDSVAQFRVPSMRACETDMRFAKVSANGSAPIEAIVRVPPTMTLSPAESRVLTADDLKCLRLPAADQDYVLSAANTTIPTAEMESLIPLVTVRVLGVGFPSASTLASSDAGRPFVPFAGVAARAIEEPALPQMALKGNYSQAPVQFDPRYATAVVGDTLRFVDWYSFNGNPQICQQSAASVPSYQAQVVAVSGQVAVVIDLRHASAAAYMDPAKLGWLRDAAAMTDKYLLPTMRSLFDPDYAPPAGGGGRFYLMLGTMPGGISTATGFAYDGPLPTINIASQATCALSSEMVVSTINAERLTLSQYQNPAYVASVFLHEYAHNADALSNGRGRIAGMMGEGLATVAMETASRIASNQPIGARHSAVGPDAPQFAESALGMWGTDPQLGPWQFNGRYGANARMILFLRELAGEASIGHGKRPTLYERLVTVPIDAMSRPAVIAHVTSVLGISFSDLTDRQTLASVTAGLIDPAIVHDLPRYTAWNHAERASTSGPRSSAFPGRANRYATAERTLSAADGGHAALYLMGDGLRGVSLELVSMIPSARIVRLTRLR